jgi:hypothetical protein
VSLLCPVQSHDSLQFSICTGTGGPPVPPGCEYTTSHGPLPQTRVVPIPHPIPAQYSLQGPSPHWSVVFPVQAPCTLQSSSHRYIPAVHVNALPTQDVLSLH